MGNARWPTLSRAKRGWVGNRPEAACVENVLARAYAVGEFGLGSATKRRVTPKLIGWLRSPIGIDVRCLTLKEASR
jgi:hypothetical protein